MTENKGDLISRKWLTDAIRNRRTYLSYEDAKDVIDLIDNAPTVEERPQGDWRDNLIEVFRQSAEVGGDTFHLFEIERIINGEPI